MSEKNSNELNRLVSRYIDGDLSSEDEKAALHLIAEDEEMRSMLRFDRFLSRSLSDELEAERFSVPDDFTDSVMSRINEMEESSSAEESWVDSVWQTVVGWFAPHEYSFRPALLYMVPALLLITYIGFLKGNNQPIAGNNVSEVPAEVSFASDGPRNSEKVWMRFVYIDEDAQQVSVAGNFSDWEPVEMSSQVMNGKKVWSGLVPVERGEQRYMFVKDGEEWISDPLAEVHRDDGFGNKNAVVHL